MSRLALNAVLFAASAAKRAMRRLALNAVLFAASAAKSAMSRLALGAVLFAASAAKSAMSRFALIAVLFVAASARAQLPERRFAIAVGSNVGAPGHARLRFAEADASRFADALKELGGFRAEDVRVLHQPTRAQLLVEVRALEQRIVEAARRSSRRNLLLLYWSGHATEQGLELGSESVAFAELRKLLGASRAHVRLAFVDACRSGGLVTSKGAKALPGGFELNVTSDESPDGTAILASSGPGENALESAELRGSFFTHHLTAGLRGAADADGDSRITLQEAYRYAYAKTVSHTAEVSGVAQRPTYALDLKGKGDLVLTELRRADARLVFAPGSEPDRRWLVVRDEGLGEVLELREDPVKPRQLALRAGSYRLIRTTANDVRTGAFALTQGEERTATTVTLTQRPFADRGEKGDALRGEGFGRELELLAAVGLNTPPLRGMGLAPALLLGGDLAMGTSQTLRIRARYQDGQGQDAGLPYALRSLGGDIAWLWRLPVRGLEAGGRLGADAVRQSVASTSAGTAFRGRAGAVLSYALPLGGRVSWFSEAEAQAASFRLNDRVVLRPAFEAVTGLGFRL
ncbi:caspase family protein [Corallococcus sicarius]|uniref:Caspase family protein n=1 Tax=Corallococcus sicarius TaxID=2316726 RepID=A0A3A8NVT3_9BACT|nr:caspase family protein [Corallococcus sicarius]RKH48173.1 caspase family protein [Corallococcus sicarius]